MLIDFKVVYIIELWDILDEFCWAEKKLMLYDLFANPQNDNYFDFKWSRVKKVVILSENYCHFVWR